MMLSAVQTRATSLLKGLPESGDSVKRSKAVQNSVDQLVREFPDHTEISRVALSMSKRSWEFGTKESLLRQALQLTAQGGHSPITAACLLLDKALDENDQRRIAEGGFDCLTERGHLKGGVARLVSTYGNSETKRVALKAETSPNQMENLGTARELFLTKPELSFGSALIKNFSQKNLSMQLAGTMMGGFGIFANEGRERGVVGTFFTEPEPKTLSDGAKIAAKSLFNSTERYRPGSFLTDLLSRFVHGQPSKSYLSYAPGMESGQAALEFFEKQSAGDAALVKLTRTALEVLDKHSYNANPNGASWVSVMSAGIQHMGEPDLTGQKVAQTIGSLAEASLDSRQEVTISTLLGTATRLDHNYQGAFRAAATIVDSCTDRFGAVKENFQAMMCSLSAANPQQDPVRLVAGAVGNGEALQAVDNVLNGAVPKGSEDKLTQGVWKALASEAATPEEREAARTLLKA